MPRELSSRRSNVNQMPPRQIIIGCDLGIVSRRVGLLHIFIYLVSQCLQRRRQLTNRKGAFSNFSLQRVLACILMLQGRVVSSLSLQEDHLNLDMVLALDHEGTLLRRKLMAACRGAVFWIADRCSITLPNKGELQPRSNVGRIRACPSATQVFIYPQFVRSRIFCFFSS